MGVLVSLVSRNVFAFPVGRNLTLLRQLEQTVRIQNQLGHHGLLGQTLHLAEVIVDMDCRRSVLEPLLLSFLGGHWERV